MRLMASARRMLGRRFDYPLLRAHDNFGQQKRTSHMEAQRTMPRKQQKPYMWQRGEAIAKGGGLPILLLVSVPRQPSPPLPSLESAPTRTWRR